MKNKKDISNLIRDNQHKLEERPSERTWKRLESKLDNRRSKGHTFLYRQIAMAAAVIALVAVISLITVLSDQQSSKFAKADDTTSTENWLIQDLETVYSDASTNIRMVVEFQKQLKDQYTNPIQEGTQAKKLLASNKTFTGSVNRPERLAKEMLAIKERKEMKSNVTANEIVETESALASKQVASDDANVSTSKMARAKKEEIPGINYLSTIQQLEWMVGVWNEQNTIHEIQKANKSTILWDDFVLKDKRNGGLHLINAKTQQSYGLIKDEGDKKVFSTKESDRIILEKINTKKFTLTFLPASGIKTISIFTK